MKIRIKHILRCYQSGMSIRSISSSLLISRNTVKRYIHIYEDMGIELERLLKMDEHHLHELFGTETDNESTGSAEYKYLQEHIPEYIKRLKSRGTTRRSLYEEYLRNRPQGYSYCSFCLYLRHEREVKIPVGRIDHIAGDQMYVDFAGDKLYISDYYCPIKILQNHKIRADFICEVSPFSLDFSRQTIKSNYGQKYTF